ncbi:uncharacterized protein LOC142221108 [Haematobia irritans]|uniref:uncharacterized protein LOC142221108 n=1 Tax=Haematobia irritans TaxID=7368 RepID=UPI003F504BEA
MMVSSVVMILLATTLYNRAYSVGIPTFQTTTIASNEMPTKREATNNLEYKIQTLVESITRMENSIQNLQEKSHTWSIFQHHIESWNDGLRTLENKLDILKRSHEDQQDLLSKLEVGLSTSQDTTLLMDEIRDTLKKDQGMQEESSSKVDMILSHLQTMGNNNHNKQQKGGSSSSHSLPKKKGNIIASDVVLTSNASNKILNTIVHQMAQQKDLKQLHTLEKRIAKSVETLSQSVPHILDKQDEMVLRLQRSNECCYSLSSELTTFTESSDILLKRIERLINNVNEKLNKIEQLQIGSSEEIDDSKEDPDDNVEDTSILHTDIFVDANDTSREILEEDDEIGDVSNEITKGYPALESSEEDEEITHSSEADDSLTTSYEPDIEFLRPELTGCHELDTEDISDDGSTRIDGIYKFAKPEINENERDFNERLCVFPMDNNTHSSPWTVIQQRVPSLQQENFNRSWLEYRNGFGHLYKDFWFGNEFIHRLVYDYDYELRIELEDFEGSTVWAEYGIFRIDTENFNYNLLIGDYRLTSTVPDAMKYHNDKDFSTYDKRNDNTIDACCSCAVGYGSGWWFDNCSEANLNGIYNFSPLGHNYIGIIWELWHGDYSLKRTRMMIRPKMQHNPIVNSTHLNEVHQKTEDP